MQTPRVGISPCLLGEEEPIDLIRFESGVRMRGTQSGKDYTEAVTDYAEEKTRALRAQSLDGYVLKSGSPSCGRENVKTFDANDPESLSRDGRGLFAVALLRNLPSLPVVEEIDLQSIGSQAHFVERIFAHRRARRLFPRETAVETLGAFHERHELQIVAHSAEGRARLARIVARAGAAAGEEVAARYVEVFSRVLARPATRERHVGALSRARNRLLGRVTPALAADLARSIRDYENGAISLSEARLRLHDAANECREPLLMVQSYLEPEAAEREALAGLDAPSSR
jgi:uncharacterized protein YbbK (DUF523 family)/uncharacterized protein YbgA (DUF1722 family)